MDDLTQWHRYHSYFPRRVTTGGFATGKFWRRKTDKGGFNRYHSYFPRWADPAFKIGSDFEYVRRIEEEDYVRKLSSVANSSYRNRISLHPPILVERMAPKLSGITDAG